MTNILILSYQAKLWLENDALKGCHLKHNGGKMPISGHSSLRLELTKSISL